MEWYNSRNTFKFLSKKKKCLDDIIVTSAKAEFKYFVDADIDTIGPVPICVVSEFFEGRCVTIGSSDWLIEGNDYGVDAADNLKFLTNVIEWLSFER